TATYALLRFPLLTVAFRGHGFSLLAPARGMPTLSAKDGFSCPSSTTLRGLQTRAIPAGQGRLRQILHRTKKIGLYFRGVNGPPLQTTITKGNSNCFI